MPASDQIDPNDIGTRLADARKGRGVTEEDAANHIGCGLPTLIAIEQGTRQPSGEEIIALAKLYGRKVSEIVRTTERLADLINPVTDARFPDRNVLLAVQAFDQGEISEGELASLLRCDRVSAREIVLKNRTNTEFSEDRNV